ncbi:alcohol dehydrogenase catalytic domain-containing protein [Kibdelosporangium persicum]|uniref:alcohol dehydrogenase n=1 Tax=Kibdelosporangium persicum TaxID=2698649 RepID=A0ABX2FG45_9PSEU|nr:zinc-dependent alcohol dehydrogenase [Kibdelosporangium persicum]NRN70345.1 Propanol-preferring alcohol dehydrogenase [Kibdelosporangium persicum]
MRAAVITDFSTPLELREVPTPEPGSQQVLVRMEACGICHTDIHITYGDWPIRPELPRIPGHEGVGIVERVGAGVTTSRIGQRVALPWLGSACGQCGFCVSGWETLCESQRNTGYSIDGGYAEYAVVDARYAVAVPDGVPPIEAAPLTCAGVTSYKAVRAGRVGPADRVAVFGVGGLGHLAIQYALHAGGFVTAVDIEADKLDLALKLGAEQLVDASAGDPAAVIQAQGGADVAIVLATAPSAYEHALRSLRRGGRLVCVGIPAGGVLPVPIFDAVTRGISVIGSIVGTRQDLAEVFALHAAGRTTVTAEPRKLEQINEAFADVLANRVRARLVIEY